MGWPGSGYFGWLGSEILVLPSCGTLVWHGSLVIGTNGSWGGGWQGCSTCCSWAVGGGVQGCFCWWELILHGRLDLQTESQLSGLVKQKKKASLMRNMSYFMTLQKQETLFLFPWFWDWRKLWWFLWTFRRRSLKVIYSAAGKWSLFLCFFSFCWFWKSLLATQHSSQLLGLNRGPRFSITWKGDTVWSLLSHVYNIGYLSCHIKILYKTPQAHVILPMILCSHQSLCMPLEVFPFCLCLSTHACPLWLSS